MSTASFFAVIEMFGINPFVRVSAARARAIKPNWRRPLPVLVRINGHPRAQPWRINLMPMGGGAFYLYLHGDVRRAPAPRWGIEFGSRCGSTSAVSRLGRGKTTAKSRKR